MSTASAQARLTGPDEPLFYLPGATEGTLQWKAATLQLVNWGGFEGRVRFDFHPGATLISGASGTGKSTLLDAYIALMMPYDTPFNGASNDAVTGRARGEEQRNLLSYLRGKTDTTTDDRGRVDQVLRGAWDRHLGCGRDDLRQRSRSPVHHPAGLLRGREGHY